MAEVLPETLDGVRAILVDEEGCFHRLRGMLTTGTGHFEFEITHLIGNHTLSHTMRFRRCDLSGIRAELYSWYCAARGLPLPLPAQSIRIDAKPRNRSRLCVPMPWHDCELYFYGKESTIRFVLKQFELASDARAARDT